ncbi:ependymin-1-like [Styela clava]
MFKFVLLFVVSSVVVFAQERACVAPKQFESRLYQYDHYTNFYRKGRMIYDAVGERVRFIEETAENQTRPSEDILILFRERKEYTLDLKTGKCVTSSPKMDFRPIGVEPGYKHAEDLIIGSIPEEGVEISVWYMTENSTDVQGTFISEFTRHDCIPFYHEFEGMMHGGKMHYHRTYYDVTLREIKPEDFNVPKECSPHFGTTLL